MDERVLEDFVRSSTAISEALAAQLKNQSTNGNGGLTRTYLTIIAGVIIAGIIGGIGLYGEVGVLKSNSADIKTALKEQCMKLDAFIEKGNSHIHNTDIHVSHHRKSNFER